MAWAYLAILSSANQQHRCDFIYEHKTGRCMARGSPTACATARYVFGFKDVGGKELQKLEFGLFILATTTGSGTCIRCQSGVMHSPLPALYVGGRSEEHTSELQSLRHL